MGEGDGDDVAAWGEAAAVAIDTKSSMGAKAAILKSVTLSPV